MTAQDAESVRPPWAEGDMPDPRRYLESERFVAGALSTMEPFRDLHPAWCLPFARQALDALGQWDPNSDDLPAHQAQFDGTECGS